MERSAKKTRKMTAKGVACPECNHPTGVTCLRHQEERTVRIRYRKCPNCSHKFKTSQQVSPSVGPEVIVPYLAPEQLSALRGSKLEEREVLDIKAMLEKGVYSRKELALQYEMSINAIRDIAIGDSWKHLTAAPS